MNYDVIVAGGGTAGCAAAYTAAKCGLKTLLIEKNSYLGGTITSALVVPAMKTSDNQINTDFFYALKSELMRLDGEITYCDGNEGWFNPELTKIALDRLMAKVGVEVLFNTYVSGVSFEGRCIKSVTITPQILSVCIAENNAKSNLKSSEMLSVYIAANHVIDATGNCEIAKISGCEFLENENEKQPVTLRFLMDGIDLKSFGDWLLDFDSDRDVTTVCEINGQTHLSTAYTWDKDKNWALKPLFEDAVENGVLKDEDRAYFQVFTVPNMNGGLAFNCPRVYFDNEINPLNNIEVSKALVKGRESIIRLAEFCKTYLPGFEKSYISSIADSIGVRVSRRIKGKYVYTKEDLVSGKTFENPVLVGNYPIDVHSNKEGGSILLHSGDYQLPVEALMSADFDNLYAVGRCLSADFFAQAALRIQPACFSMGEGLAKYIAKLSN